MVLEQEKERRGGRGREEGEGKEGEEHRGDGREGAGEMMERYEKEL